MTDQPDQRWKEFFPRPPQAYVLVLAGAGVPFLALFVPDQIAMVLPFLGFLALVLNPVTGLWPLKTQSYLLPLGLLTVFGFLSAFWSAETAGSFDAALRLLFILATGTLLLTHARELARPERLLIGWALLNGFAILYVLFVADRLTGGWLVQEVTGAKTDTDGMVGPGLFLALLSWPVGGFLWAVDRRGMAIAVFLATPVALIGVAGSLPLVILGLAWLFALPAMVLPIVARYLATIGAVFCVVVLPFAAGSSTVFETAYRMMGASAHAGKQQLVSWHYLGLKIAERPFLGGGLDSMQTLPDRQQTVSAFTEDQGFTFMGEKTRTAIGSAPVLSDRPAGMILQIQFELGLFGLAVVAVFLVFVLGAVSANGPWMIRASRMGLTTAAVATICLAPFSLQGWWLPALFLLATFGAALPATPARERRDRDIPENSVVNPRSNEDEDEESTEGYSA